jgi:hypothetical protein
MTHAVLPVLRRLGVALLALVCLSPAPLPLPSLASVPQLLGLVPEPLSFPTPVALGEPFMPAAAPAVGVAQVAPAKGAGRAPARPGRSAARGQQQAAAPAPTGKPLPTLPLDDVPRGRYHRVEPGETAASIAAAYGLSSEWAVYDANPVMTDPQQPPVGAWLYIPHPSMLAPPRPRPGQPGYSTTPSATVTVDNIWLELAACESSGNWGIDTGNGYFGGLQFTLSSWRLTGGVGRPNEAHPMEQIARADYLQRVQGWRAWPMCAGKLGLIPQEEADAIVRAARARQQGGGDAKGEPNPEKQGAASEAP